MIQFGSRPLRIVLRKERTVHVYTAVGVETTAVTRHIIIKDTVTDEDRYVIRRRIRRVRHFRILTAERCPVTIDKYTTAAEIGLGNICMANRICSIEVVRISAGYLNTIELNRTRQDRQVTLLNEISSIRHFYRVFQDCFTPIADLIIVHILNRLRAAVDRVSMTGNDVINVGKVLTGHRITREDRLTLELPRFNHGVEVIITHGAVVRITFTDRIRRSVVQGIRGNIIVFIFDPDRDICTITDDRRIKRMSITFLTIVMMLHTRVDTTDDGCCLRDKEGIHTHLSLLVIRIMIRIIGTLLYKDLETRITVLSRVRTTRSDDIVEGITEAVERIEHTRTHLAIHISGIVVEFIILQRTCGFGVKQVRVHDIETTHDVCRIDLNLEVLIQCTGTHLDEVIMLDDKCIIPPE